MITFEIINDTKSFASLRSEWSELLAHSEANNVFLTWEWLYTWWTKYGGGHCLFIVLARENGRLVGLAPLYVREEKLLRKMSAREIRFLGSGEVCSDYLDFVAVSGRRAEIVERLVKFLARGGREFWDVALLEDVPDTSPLLQIVQNVLSSHWLSISIRNSTVCPYLPLPSSWDALLGGVSKQFRKEVRRARRELEQVGNVEFDVIRGTNGLGSALNEFIRLHEKRWNSKGLPGSFSSECFTAFHRDVARLLSDRGWLALALLSVEGRVVAARYGFVYNNTMYAYQGGYDPDWGSHQVGLVVQSYCLEDEIARGLAEHNFLRGTNVLKFRWTQQTRTNVSFRFGRDDVAHSLAECEQFIDEGWKISAKSLLPTALIDRWRSYRS